ncbi:homing endonuclease associated repeat-containing protein [Haloquadratum walsbyi]|jgi:hypothetical protein
MILQSLHGRLNRIPKPSELPEDPKYSQREFYTECGSWDEALEAAGIDNEQILLDDLRQVADKVEYVSAIDAIDEHGTYSHSITHRILTHWTRQYNTLELNRGLKRNQRSPVRRPAKRCSVHYSHSTIG